MLACQLLGQALLFMLPLPMLACQLLGQALLFITQFLVLALTLVGHPLLLLPALFGVAATRLLLLLRLGLLDTGRLRGSLGHGKQFTRLHNCLALLLATAAGRNNLRHLR